MGRRKRRQKGGLNISGIKNKIKSGFKKVMSKKGMMIKSAKIARTLAKSGVLGSKAKKFASSPFMDKAFSLASSQMGKGFTGTMYTRGKRRRQKGGIFPLLPLLAGAIL